MTEGRAPGRSWLGVDGTPASPDWRGTRAIVIVALACGLAVCATLAIQYWSAMPIHDTDDAMRLAIVRDLVGGRGWFDQAIPRLDPPQGVWLHWSRLLDGGIAGMMIVLRQFLDPTRAEYWTRFVWPLLWIFPGLAGALAIARNLGARSAVFLTAILMLADSQLYRQFVPGRIDHHNVQIVMAVIAMACATAAKDRTRWAVLGGAATGLGLAVGLEALPLQALIGASYGLALIGERKAAGTAAAYGLTLAAVTAVLFAIETPPWRWGMGFCDAIAINLVAGIAVAGLGLALAGAASSKAPAWVRTGLVAAAGLGAGAVYLAFDPQCIHGPFAAMDPAVRPFWFNRIQEVQPLPRMMVLARPAAIVAAILLAMSVASALYLAAHRWNPPGVEIRLVVPAVVLAAVTAWFAWRMQDYVFWIGLPVMGAAASRLAARWLGDRLAPSVIAVLLLAPSLDGALAEAAVKAVGPPPPRLINSGPRCFAAQAYQPLAALPAGDVLAPQDLGPFILVFTHHSVVAAPYHRMSREILQVHRFWSAPPAEAQAWLRPMHPTYVVDCPPYPIAAGPRSFGAALRKGVSPPWLLPLSPPKATLRIYRVLPPAT